MELYVGSDNCGKDLVVLLDNEMRIVKPVYDYLKFLRLKESALNTMKAAGCDLRTYWQFLNKSGYKYNEATPNTIAYFIEYLRAGEEDTIFIYKESVRTAKTINRILSTIYQFYKYCGMMQEIDNPIIMDDINRPFNMFKSLLHHAKTDNKTKQSIFKVKETKHAVRLVADQEAEIFMNALPTRRDKVLFKILYLTGARIQEVLDLEIESIPVPDSSKLLGVLEQIKSKGKYRDLYIPMSLIEELDAFIFKERCKIDTEHSYIFVDQQKQHLGKHLTYRGIYEVFKKVQYKTGIHFNFHDLRHTFCTTLIESGMDVSVVRIIMGHEHISTTQKYAHLSNQYIVDSLAKYWSKSSLIGGDKHEGKPAKR